MMAEQLNRGEAGGARRSFSYQEAQEEALRLRQKGNVRVALALTLNSPVAAETRLPEDG
jgi:hypothetical protein